MDINNYNNYKPQSQQQAKNNSLYIVGNAYRNNEVLIEQPNFINPNTTLHNNLNSNLLSEHIVEYYLNIDSDDRKIDVYPDPFNYVVSLNPIGRSSGKNKFKNDRERGERGERSEKTEYAETPAPFIIRNFKNVKYVKLDRVILSRANIIKFVIDQTITINDTNQNVTVSSEIDRKIHNFQDNTGACTLCHCDDCQCIMSNKNKFILLKVKELETFHIYSTNTIMSDNTFVLYVDKTLGSSNNMWFPTYGSCIYPDSLLTNLDRLSIEFYGKDGEPLTPQVIVEYNITITYGTQVIDLQYCLTFGKIKEIVLNKLKKKYKTCISFKFNDLCKIDTWFDRIFNDILNGLSNDIKIILSKKNGDKLVNYDKIMSSLISLDLCDKLKCCVSNNVFFIVGVLQNELNTMTKYEK